MVREHRLPTRLSIALDRLLILCGFRHKTIVASGLRFRVRRLAADEHFVRDVVVDEEYSPSGYAITANDIVVDIGGNIGSFAVYAAAKARGGRVVSLEPIRDNFRLLIRNIASNSLGNVAAKHAALVARRGSVRIYISTIGSGGHSMLPGLAQQNRTYEDVEGVTLENVFDEFQLSHCDFLKLDCEGAEFEILENVDPNLCRRINKLVVEYHTFPDRDKLEQSNGLVERLADLGFTVDVYTDVIGTNWGTIYARRSVG